jgi:hypothetical protein
MSGTYDKNGIRFLYPDNWQITDEETVDWPRFVSIQSPGGGFWSLLIYRANEDPSSLTEEVLTTMRAEYEDVEADLVDDEFAGFKAAGYDMFFYCLDFVVNSRTLAGRSDDRTILLVWQAEDGEFQELEPVFRAITTSLLQ